MEKKNMNVQTIWNIRDARGLDANEKAFLYTVASRGASTASRETLCDDAGFSNGTLGNVVKSLTDKGLITVYPGQWVHNQKLKKKVLTTTMYVINDDVLAEAVQEMEDLFQEMEDQFHHMEEVVQEMEEVVHVVDSKGTDKVTEKETSKGTEKELLSATADAASQSSSNPQVKKKSTKDKNPTDLPNSPKDPAPSNSPKTPKSQLGEGGVFSGVSDEECKNEAIRLGISNSYISHRGANFPPRKSLELAKSFAGLSV